MQTNCFDRLHSLLRFPSFGIGIGNLIGYWLSSSPQKVSLSDDSGGGAGQEITWGRLGGRLGRTVQAIIRTLGVT